MKSTQLALIDGKALTELDVMDAMDGFDWSKHVRSCVDNEALIISSIMKLYNHNKAFHLDPCYSTGRFYNGLPRPKIRFDISPQSPDVIQNDVRCLPNKSGTIASIMFDPPFVAGKDKSSTGKIRTRFSSFFNMKELIQFYKDSLRELSRVLKTDGILVVKCQDTVSAGTQWMSHVLVINECWRLGLYMEDLFIIYRKNLLFSPNMKVQKHARKNHCYFLVFRKIKNMDKAKRMSVLL